jgi:hypothetical protein
MHIQEFKYLRMNGVAGAGEWDSLPVEAKTWNIWFPDSAIRFVCRAAKGAEIVLQTTVNPDSTKILKFKQGAHIVIVANMLYYFEIGLDKENARYPL